MSILLVFTHVIVCIALILIVLLQTGKGADMGAAFGGGSSQTLFGSTGASTFLSKMTTGAAIVFMLTSLALAYVSTHRQSGSIMMDQASPAPAQPAQTEAQPESQPASQPETASEAVTETASEPAEDAPPAAAESATDSEPPAPTSATEETPQGQATDKN
ncbi:MAG: preprotein translocase subunit SecG [Desulfobacterales bacterium]